MQALRQKMQLAVAIKAVSLNHKRQKIDQLQTQQHGVSVKAQNQTDTKVNSLKHRDKR